MGLTRLAGAGSSIDGFPVFRESVPAASKGNVVFLTRCACGKLAELTFEVGALFRQISTGFGRRTKFLAESLHNRWEE